MEWLYSEMDPGPNGTECECFNWVEIELQFLNFPDPDSKPFVVSFFWQVWKFSMPAVPYVKVEKKMFKNFWHLPKKTTSQRRKRRYFTFRDQTTFLKSK